MQTEVIAILCREMNQFDIRPRTSCAFIFGDVVRAIEDRLLYLVKAFSCSTGYGLNVSGRG